MKHQCWPTCTAHWQGMHLLKIKMFYSTQRNWRHVKQLTAISQEANSSPDISRIVAHPCQPHSPSIWHQHQRHLNRLPLLVGPRRKLSRLQPSSTLRQPLVLDLLQLRFGRLRELPVGYPESGTIQITVTESDMTSSTDMTSSSTAQPYMSSNYCFLCYMHYFYHFYFVMIWTCLYSMSCAHVFGNKLQASSINWGCSWESSCDTTMAPGS